MEIDDNSPQLLHSDCHKCYYSLIVLLYCKFIILETFTEDTEGNFQKERAWKEPFTQSEEIKNYSKVTARFTQSRRFQSAHLRV